MEHNNYLDDNQLGRDHPPGMDHHQISSYDIDYSSVWPNCSSFPPLQVLHNHQAQSSSASLSHQIHHYDHHHHHLQLLGNFMIDQEEITQHHELEEEDHPHPHPKEGFEEDQEEEEEEEEVEELGAMKEMMYKIAAMQPVDIDPATIRKPKRRNVRISDDPQSVAARHRRERISEKIRILQRLVPGGTKMDTASMLDEAIRYVKFLKRQIRLLQKQQQSSSSGHRRHINTAADLAAGGTGGALEWLPTPPVPPGSASTANDETPSTTSPIGFITAFGGGR